MDTSPEYVRMCQKATEIQKVWNTNDNSNYIAEILDNYALLNIYMGHILNSSIRILKANNQGENYVWLPRQDQLQDIFDTDFFGQLQFFSDCFESGNTLRQELFGTTKSWEQIWLSYVMFMKYNKVWNGGDWVRMNSDTPTDKQSGITTSNMGTSGSCDSAQTSSEASDSPQTVNRETKGVLQS